jgi:hypothetical protein
MVPTIIPTPNPKHKLNYYPDFSTFIKYMNTKDILNADKVSSEARFFIGFGNAGMTMSFPMDFLKASEAYTNYIFLFDPEFAKSKSKFAAHISQGTRNIKIELHMIASYVPITSDIHQLQIAKHAFRLQQEASSFSYYESATCTIDNDDVTNEWVLQFTHLIRKINELRKNLYVVNDAWWSTSNPFSDPKLSIKHINFYGKNFEQLCIIPKLLLSNMDISKLFIIKWNSHTEAIPFTHTNAVYKYTPEDGNFSISKLDYLMSLPNTSAAESPEAAAAAAAAAATEAAHGGAGAASSTRLITNLSFNSNRRGGSRQHNRKRFRSRRSKSRRNKSKTYRRKTKK